MTTITILDGGMSRELQRLGAPFRQPEWSALALIEAPEYVQKAHESYINAGARVITTNSYALVPFHIGAERFRSDGLRLIDLAGQLARKAVTATGTPTLVAGSLPPVFGSYRPDLFDSAHAQDILGPLIAGLSPHVDLWLGETLSSIQEAEAVRTALSWDAKPLWISFTLDDVTPDPQVARLRSGEPVSDAVRALVRLHASAILFNCSQPEVMAAAVKTARETLAGLQASLRIGVYANAFAPQKKDAEANAELDEVRADLTPSAYLRFAQEWVDQGADLVGGCCGIGPDHIAKLAETFR